MRAQFPKRGIPHESGEADPWSGVPFGPGPQASLEGLDSSTQGAGRGRPVGPEGTPRDPPTTRVRARSP